MHSVNSVRQNKEEFKILLINNHIPSLYALFYTIQIRVYGFTEEFHCTLCKSRTDVLYITQLLYLLFAFYLVTYYSQQHFNLLGFRDLRFCSNKFIFFTHFISVRL